MLRKWSEVIGGDGAIKEYEKLEGEIETDEG